LVIARSRTGRRIGRRLGRERGGIGLIGKALFVVLEDLRRQATGMAATLIRPPDLA
jgi:hypothetical protein